MLPVLFYTVQKMQTPEELYDAAFKLETDKTYLTGLDITYGTYVGLYYYTGEVAIEEKATEILSKPVVVATADVKMGDAKATAWGCDLTHGYISINADYRS